MKQIMLKDDKRTMGPYEIDEDGFIYAKGFIFHLEDAIKMKLEIIEVE